MFKESALEFLKRVNKYLYKMLRPLLFNFVLKALQSTRVDIFLL